MTGLVLRTISIKSVLLNLRTICKILNKNPKKFIKFIKDRPYNDRRYSISTRKINKFGLKPEYRLKNELLNIIQWYKKNIKLFKNFKL